MDIKPITREEMYLAKAAGQDVSLPEPITRKEMFLAKMAGMEVETPSTFTRLERFANEAAVALNRSVIEPLEITENGTYTAPDGVDGYNPVTVNVDPTKITILREQQFDGFAWDESFGAYSPGFVSPAQFVLNSGGTYYVIWDGAEYECTAFAFDFSEMSMVAIGNGTSMGLPGNDEPFLITYNIPGNGTQLFAIDNSDSHTVGIWQKAESGGGSLPAGAYWEALPIPYVNIYQQCWFQLNGYLYAFLNGYSGNGEIRYIYKYLNGAWTLVKDFGESVASNIRIYQRPPLEYNGKVHFYYSKKHFTFDGVSIQEKNDLPKSMYGQYRYDFIQDGKMKIQVEAGTVYVWDEVADTWSEEATLTKTYLNFYTINGVVYAFSGNKVYTYAGGKLTDFATLDISNASPGVQKDGKVYFYVKTYNKGLPLYEFDPVSKVNRKVGLVPFVGTYMPITILDNKIAFTSFEVTYPVTLVLHEVT